MLTRALLGVAALALMLLARPALPQQSPPPTATPYALGWDPARATIHAAYAQATVSPTPRASTRGYDPVMATFQAAYSDDPTPTPQAYTRGYDPLFITLQAWAGGNANAQPTPTATAQTYTRGYDPLFATLQAWASRIAATATPTAMPCAWVSTNRHLEEDTGRIQAAIDATGAEGIVLAVSAFGENCVDSNAGEVRRFLLRDLTYQLTVSGGSAADMGDALALALPVVQSALKTESRPIYQIRILFADADLDPIALTPALLDEALSVEAGGAAFVARLYAVSLR
jgi:hypothetical protein